MRRALATVLAVSAAAVALGCGGGDSGSPLDTALSYLPKDAVFAAALDTDVDGDQYRALDSLLKEFAFSGELRDRLREQLDRVTEGRFDEDVRPLLGNPVVVGSAAVGDASSPVVALEVEDKDKLDDVVDRITPRELGEAAGATLYEDNETFFAVEDDVVVFADDRRQLTAAVERADGDDHLDEDTFNSSLEDLPETALVRVYADVEALLKEDTGSADARRVKWVAALRTLGATVVAKKNGLETEFRLRTEGDLSDADLPIASGDEAPGVISRRGELGLGVRDLAHIVHFAENAAQSIDPGGFGDYAQAKKTIDTQLGISLDDDLIGQLTGDVSASVALDGGFGVRAELEDPEAFQRTLEKVADVLPSFAQGAGFGPVELSRLHGRNTLYALSSRGGGQVVFGVVDQLLVVASDGRRATQLAAQDPTNVPGANGSVVVGADAEQLANTLIEQFGAAFGVPDLGGLGMALVTGPLGDLNGHVSASPDELRGRLTLATD